MLVVAVVEHLRRPTVRFHHAFVTFVVTSATWI
jgi:hypothetical protein